MNLGQDIGSLLIQFLFSFLIVFVMLRFLLAWVRADFYNPLSQAIVSITNPILVPLRRVIPPIGRIDTAAIVLMLVLQVAELALLLAIHGRPTPWAAILIASIVQLVRLGVWIFIAAIFVGVIISWVAPGTRNPVGALAASLTEPLMRPLRRVIPPFGMIDITPMIAILILFIALRVLDHLVGYV
ncbi:MAG TPA: YggT family protein [Thioalkalivibrio sp.]|nr:YggT family protein [Thioalkalivibrio sp.]